MIPKFRAWKKVGTPEMFNDVRAIDFDKGIVKLGYRLSKDTVRIDKEKLNKMILMQSTGIKDKNDVEIFEGDILKGPMDFGPAGFVESVAPVSYHKINGYQLHYFLLEHTEVIGNVYEDKNIKFGTEE